MLLLIASYVFYGWWDWRFLWLLWASTIIDYAAGLIIEKSPSVLHRRIALFASLGANLGALCYFKYFDFFITSTVAALQALGFEAHMEVLNILLPVGISFYAFQTMSYTIDVYRGECPASKSLLDFAVFVTFFPHLVAGPIQRAVHLLPQFEKDRVIRAEPFVDGIWLIVVGYLKKTVIADRLAELVDLGFSGTTLPEEGAGNWLYLYAFAFQVYGDFAGYTDIARGLAQIMGFNLTLNFRAPYLARNPPEFWAGWHICLSTWLRDYLYIPMGGNRGGPWKTYRNLMATMLLGGLWHGAGWAYFFWGLYQGLLLAVHRAASPSLKRITAAIAPVGTWRASLANVLTVVVFFHLTCIGWLIFRVGSVPRDIDQLHFLSSTFATLFKPGGLSPLAISLLRPLAFCGGLCLLLQWKDDDIICFSTWRPWPQAVAVALGILLILTLGVFDGTQFIYFQF
ncbi:MAG: MBOAT family protein [Planctomycetia bacterium]|nr:MBOAT family protein [Planctomycetia bacterium]